MKRQIDDNIRGLADELANIRAQIDKLEERKDDIREIFMQAGVTHLEGAEFEVVRVEQDREKINWKKIALAFEPSPQRIRGNTKTIPVVQFVTRKLEKDQ